MSAGTAEARRPDPARIAAELRASRSYGHLCEQALWRMACWAACRSPTVRGAVKIAKRKLHQVYGAYVVPWKPGPDGSWTDQQRWLLSGWAASPDVRARCLRAMALHASTRERAPFLDRFYRDVFEVTGVPRSVLDLGCGLHPLGLPWMGLPPGSRYDAVDMDARAVAVVREFFAWTGQAGTVRCGDLLDAGAGTALRAAGTPPDEGPEDRFRLLTAGESPYDVAFLLKTVPCLEHQQEGASERLLRAVPAHKAVISFACTSLGAGRRQALGQYEALAERLAGNLGLAVRLLIGNELVYAFAGGPDPPAQGRPAQ